MDETGSTEEFDSTDSNDENFSGTTEGELSTNVFETPWHMAQTRLAIRIPVGENPPWSEAQLYTLGLNSWVAAFATMAMVPPVTVSALGGNSHQKAQLIQAAFFTTAINSILQIWFGTRLPVLTQRSRHFALPVAAIAFSSASRYKGPSYSQIHNTVDSHNQGFEESIKRIQGATIIAAFFQIFFGFSSLGVVFARKLNSLTLVPLLSLTGFRIYTTGFSVLANCNIQLGLPALVLLVFSAQYLPDMWKSKKVFLQQYSVTICAVFLWFYAEILIRVGAYSRNESYRNQGTEFRCDSYIGVLQAAPWIRVPRPFPYGGPVFKVGDVLLIMAASFVDAIEASGTNIAESRLAGDDKIPPSALSRGIGWQGISNMVNAFFGSASGSSSSAEEAGFVGLTQVGSRRVILLSVFFMLICSMIGKLSALIASIPLPIQVAMQMVLLPIFASTGLDYLQFCNMNSFRVLFILGTSIFAGFSVPQYFYEYDLLEGKGPIRTHYTWFNDAWQVIFSSAPTVGLVVALVLDRTFPSEDTLTTMAEKPRKMAAAVMDPYGDSNPTYAMVSSFKDLFS